MPVKNGQQVTVDYVGTLDDGTVFDSTEGADCEPLVFIVGAGQLIPGFDKAVIGMETGETKQVRLQPEDAYGQHDPEGVQKIPRKNFPKDFKPEKGRTLHMSTPDGMHVHATLVDFDKDSITIDMNSPLAGKVLNFKITIKDYGEPDPSQCSGSCGCCDHEH